MTDFKAKGAADFKAASKDHVTFHDAGNNGRLYREGWHAARRAAEDDDRLAGFEHAGQTPVEPPAAGTPETPAPRAEDVTAGERADPEPDLFSLAAAEPPPANRPKQQTDPECLSLSNGRAGDFCDACGKDKPGHTGRNVDCAPAVGLWICDDCAAEADEAKRAAELAAINAKPEEVAAAVNAEAATLPPTFPGDPLSAHRDGVAASQLAELPSLPEPPGQTTLLPGLKDPEQLNLLDVDPDWKKHWAGMPEFRQDDLKPWASLPIHFKSRADRDAFSKLIGQTITDDTRSLWYPKAEIARYVDKRWKTSEPVLPRFPVYVISKGRWEKRLTADSLDKIGVPYRLVIEPQEVENYVGAGVDRSKILVLPFSNLGMGSIPARNWVWQHAVDSGAERHWILDDNIDGFFRLHNNLKVPVATGATFKACEDYTERYENVALSGMQYFMFASRKAVIPPITLNTRIYSCILINHRLTARNIVAGGERDSNQLAERWRGRYNEDTDLSIRALKAGWCTILFNAFLAYKITTMSMGGGNTDSLYKIVEGGKDGRLLMAESLRDQHPELVKIVHKWGRWQHHVHFRIFRGNELRPRPGVSIDAGANNYGMELEHLEGV